MINKITEISIIQTFFKSTKFLKIVCSISKITKLTIKTPRSKTPARAIPPLLSINKKFIDPIILIGINKIDKNKIGVFFNFNFIYILLLDKPLLF